MQAVDVFAHGCYLFQAKNGIKRKMTHFSKIHSIRAIHRNNMNDPSNKTLNPLEYEKKRFMKKFELEKKLFNFKVVGGTLGHPVHQHESA